MTNLSDLKEEFKYKHEAFITGCDSVEQMGLWNLDELGEMDVFYANEMMSLILRLVVADGRVEQGEVDFINDLFGFSYSLKELKEVYENCEDLIASIFDSEIPEGLHLLRSINERLAGAYRELLALLSDIIIAGDGVVSEKETVLAKRLKEIE